MSTPTNHWKLGLFVIVGIILAACTVVFLGAKSLKKESVDYKTYFDESVQGLEVGSPIKFRGVTIGNVSSIDVAPDHRHVAVTSALTINDLSKLGLSDGGAGRNTKIRIPVDLRVQLASQGITGVKFLQIDFFDVKDNPPPNLPFAVPENYIPAARSVLKNLEDAIVHAMNRIPDLADGVLRITVQISRILDDVESKKLPEQAVTTLHKVNSAIGTLQDTIVAMNAGKLSSQAQDVLTNLNTTVTRTNAILARVDGDKGVIASATRASNAVGDVAVNARGLGQELETTLREIQAVTAAIQRVVDALERDPDMLLKGRGKPK